MGSSLAAFSGVSLTEKVLGKFGKEGLALLRGAREAVEGFRVGGRTFREIAVIGKTPGTFYRIGEKGAIVYNRLPWNITKNLEWIDDLVRRGVPVEVISPLNKNTLYKATGELTPFGEEIKRLEGAGYQHLDREGRHFMVPR